MTSTSLDPTHFRRQAAYRQLLHWLDRLMPPPAADTPEARADRDRAAIGKIAALCPVNAAEAELAAHFVAASAWAMDTLGDARAPGLDPLMVLKCQAQAASMFRQAHSAMRSLLLVQAARDKRKADHEAWVEHIAGAELAAALDDVRAQQAGHASSAPISAQPAPPEPALTEPAPSAPASAEPVAGTQALPSEPAEFTPAIQAASVPALPPSLAAPVEPGIDPAREAELYTVLHPKRAAAIRQAGGVPADATFPPPEDWLVRGVLGHITLRRSHAAA